jgi:hypothetical protein
VPPQRLRGGVLEHEGEGVVAGHGSEEVRGER